MPLFGSVFVPALWCSTIRHAQLTQSAQYGSATPGLPHTLTLCVYAVSGWSCCRAERGDRFSWRSLGQVCRGLCLRCAQFSGDTVAVAQGAVCGGLVQSGGAVSVNDDGARLWADCWLLGLSWRSGHYSSADSVGCGPSNRRSRTVPSLHASRSPPGWSSRGSFVRPTYR